jgi:ABC-2 type transport system ATP-binding protein
VPAEAGAIAVRVDGLAKSYALRRRWADAVRRPFGAAPRVQSLRDVSLRVAKGEFFGLLGPNGAGKTTLLRILATMVVPDAGRVTVDDYDVGESPRQVRARVASVIASERSLYWRLTARRNLLLFGALWRVPRNELADRVDRVLSVVGLLDTGTKLVGEFSSGMMQRLLIARALLAEPRVLLLDEPTRSLDPVSARDFRRFLREELAVRRECAVLLATHSAEEAFELCDRVAVLNQGQIVASGSPGALARSLTRERYVVWVRDPADAFWNPYRVPETDRPGDLAARGDLPGWRHVIVQLPETDADGSAVLRRAVVRGVEVAAFERLPLSLADLIETAVARQMGGEA